MNKRSILIISLIFTILSLIYMVLVHFHIDRYLFIKSHNTEKYINKYKELPKADKKRVIIHLAADTNQLDKLKPLVNSLLDQTVKVDEIAISIPYKNTNKIPSNLKKVLSVYGYTKDYGIATKLIPAVLQEKEADTKIIIVEPNIIYGKDFIDEIVSKSNENPTKIITSKHAHLVKPEFFKSNITDFVNDKTNYINWLQRIASTGMINLPYFENYTY